MFYPQASLNYLPSYEMPLVSTKHIEDQSFVCIRKANVSVASSVREIQLALQGFKGHSRLLSHGFDVHGLIRLKANDKLITTALPAKDVPGNITELDTNLGLSLIQSCEEKKSSIEFYFTPSLRLSFRPLLKTIDERPCEN